MVEEPPYAERREDPGNFRRQIFILTVFRFLRGDGAVMDQGFPVVEVAPEEMDKIRQFH
jgi:hypothetical protein